MYNNIDNAKKRGGFLLNRTEQILRIAEQNGIIRGRDIEKTGISRNYLYKLCKDERLIKISRGLYMHPDTPVSEKLNFSKIAKKNTNAVICLISALNFYEITTQISREVWIAIPKGGWRPSLDYPPLNLTFISKSAYLYGIQEYNINSVAVKIYSIEKTIADCFKFRNKVGLDIAIEGLKEAWKSRKLSMDKLVEAAHINRVSKVIRPYLEAIV
jgi:predicted transcriptional regulator of viral defense system